MMRKLKSMPYAQCHVIVDTNGTYLYSYTTKVVTLDNNGWLTVHGLHSMTTRKHISNFMREYLSKSYALAKQLYNDEMMYNIFTGEVKNI